MNEGGTTFERNFSAAAENNDIYFAGDSASCFWLIVMFGTQMDQLQQRDILSRLQGAAKVSPTQ